MAVVLAERSPRLLSAFTGDKAALRRVIQGAAATDEPGDVAAERASSRCRFAIPRRGGQVVLETDGAFDELPGVDTSLPWVRRGHRRHCQGQRRHHADVFPTGVSG